MLKDLVVHAIQKASTISLNRAHDLGKVTAKSPKDFVTEVDLQCEELIISTIRAKIPDVSFYGEETGRSGNGKLLFVLDPIDATTNYIRGMPLFDICIAVYEGDTNILSAVSCPALNELFVAEREKGTTLNDKPVRVTNCKDISHAIVGYNRSNHPPEIIKQSKQTLSNILDHAATFRVFGTGGLDYAYLTKGCFDACVTPLAEPYHSAGYLLMEEAGARVTDYNGNPHTLESKTIVAANPTLHPQILELVK